MCDPAPDEDVAVARLTSNGDLDTSFGENGLAFIPLDWTNFDGYDVAIQSDGLIVVVGSADNDLWVGRYYP